MNTGTCTKCFKTDVVFYVKGRRRCEDCIKTKNKNNYNRRKQNPEWVKHERLRAKIWHDKNYDVCECGKAKKPASAKCFDCYVTPAPKCVGCYKERVEGDKYHGNLCWDCYLRRKTDLRELNNTNATRRTKWLYTRYGLTEETYEQLLRDQNYKCACCFREDWGHKGPQIDHDHNLVGRISVRGILCNNCNLAIGKLDDTLEGVKRAVKYLERYESTHNQTLPSGA